MMVRTQGRWTKFISKAIADRSPQCLSASEQSNSEQKNFVEVLKWKSERNSEKIDICDKKGILLCRRAPSSAAILGDGDQ